MSSRAPTVLVVIPARGGSKGIPRKNLRMLGGRPLVTHAIDTARLSRYGPDVVVSSDDPEILAIAAKSGAEPCLRDADLASDEATLDAVVHDAYQRMSQAKGRGYDLVVTLQPTSPLLQTSSLDAALNRMISDTSVETLISATDDRHLRWGLQAGELVPLYAQRVNRQYLPPIYRETGGLLICRASVLHSDSRIGAHIALHVLSGGEAVDIDTLEDFNLCEWYLSRRHIVYVVSGHLAIGLGHVHNALTIASSLTRHDLTFVVDRDSDLAANVLRSHNYTVIQQEPGVLLEHEVLRLKPDIVINDILDTSAAYVAGLKATGAVRVVNFEDLGDGARLADIVINAIYPEDDILPNHYFGHRYFCARAEFLMTPPHEIQDRVKRILITFGGTDPNDLTRKVLEALDEPCRDRGIEIDVITGLGYRDSDSLKSFVTPQILGAVANISDYMRAADLIFTSAGRTVFEIACVGTPAIVLAQNAREMTHFFASKEYGFRHLGLGADVAIQDIRGAFDELVDRPDIRRQMSRLMLENDLRSGRDRVLRLIEEAINYR